MMANFPVFNRSDHEAPVLAGIYPCGNSGIVMPANRSECAGWISGRRLDQRAPISNKPKPLLSSLDHDD